MGRRNRSKCAIALYAAPSCAGPEDHISRLYKLPPATSLTLPFGANGLKPGALPLPDHYWSLRDAVAQGLADRWQGSDEDAVAELDDRLREAIRDQMVADVPLGAFLPEESTHRRWWR